LKTEEETMSETTLGQLPAQLEIGREYPPPGEDAAIEKLRDLHLKIQSVQDPRRRGEHPKQHAGVWARLTIATDIPSGLRVGIFKDPGTYTALVRYSNGRTSDDRLPDVHGMAIKVFIPNEDQGAAAPLQQDFILADHPIFFARNVQHIFDFLAATSAGTPASQLAMTTHPKLVGFTSVAKSSPLTLSYWSQTPYKLGDGAVKYVASPSAGQQTPAIELTQSPDALREAMIEQLTFQKIGTQFDLCVNQQSDATAMPIEDPTVEWTSPPCKLATVSIYPQKFDSSEQMSFVENLTWNPWNSLPAHSPLGGINRARRSLYIDSQQLRHKMNGIQPGLPTGRESF
jgi:hypothetical protein